MRIIALFTVALAVMLLSMFYGVPGSSARMMSHSGQFTPTPVHPFPPNPIFKYPGDPIRIQAPGDPIKTQTPTDPIYQFSSPARTH